MDNRLKFLYYGMKMCIRDRISSEQLAEYGISKNVLAGLGAEGSAGIEEALENADIPKDLQIKACLLYTSRCV